MMIRDILRSKGHLVYYVDRDCPVMDALRELNFRHIGALIVTAAGGEMIGMVTERDVLRNMEEGLEGLRVHEIMTGREDLIIAHVSDTVEYALAVFTKNRIRHLPVLSQEKLVGIISIGDAVKAQLRDMEVENKALRDYISGSYPIVS